MNKKTLFSKIIDREIPADIVYEDELCIAIRDINPRAPIHILLIPKKPIISLAHLQTEDQHLMGHMMLKLKKIAQQEGLNEHFVTRIHTGEHGGQEVFHLHIHLMGDPQKSAQ
jgi:histidine triad (HIT) family protein